MVRSFQFTYSPFMHARNTRPVIVIGGGLSGLACAHHLHEEGVPVQVLEGSDEVGGRVRTDRVETEHGRFLIDRGFQVYLTSYPEGANVLRLHDLELATFQAGAMVWHGGRFWRAADPLRSPFAGLAMATGRSPLLGRGDLLALGKMDLSLRFAGEDSAWDAPEETTESFLRGAGISEQAIDRFFRPFFGGVFLDRSLQTSARKMRWLYRLFGRGFASLPLAGMQAIPRQIAAELAEGSVETGRMVEAVETGMVRMQGGEELAASAVVIATDAVQASVLSPGFPSREWTSTISLSFAAEVSPGKGEPILFLDGEGTGPVNHVAVISDVQSSYAPEGQSLISATIVAPFITDEPDDQLEQRVRNQMANWFGPDVEAWRLLRVDRVKHALPAEGAPALQEPLRAVTTGIDGVFMAGDHLENGSINGALTCGRRAAEAVLAGIG